jgi:hypothetical protein
MAKPTNITGWAHVGYIMVQPWAIYTAIPLSNQLMGVQEGSPTADTFAIRNAHKYPLGMTNIAMVYMAHL